MNLKFRDSLHLLPPRSAGTLRASYEDAGDKQREANTAKQGGRREGPKDTEVVLAGQGSEQVTLRAWAHATDPLCAPARESPR